MNDANAALHSTVSDSLQNILCNISNSPGLAFFNSPHTTSCTSLLVERLPPPADGLFSSSLLKFILETFGFESPIEQDVSSECCFFTSQEFFKVEGCVCLWFQYSMHWWFGSSASIAWGEFSQNSKSDTERSSFTLRIKCMPVNNIYMFESWCKQPYVQHFLPLPQKH